MCKRNVVLLNGRRFLLSVQLEIIEHKSLDTSAFLERVQTLEAHVLELSSSKLSPFTQAEIIERLDKAELTVDRMRKNVYDVSEDNDKVLNPRLTSLCELQCNMQEAKLM